jgi:hypothetical protein
MVEPEGRWTKAAWKALGVPRQELLQGRLRGKPLARGGPLLTIGLTLSTLLGLGMVSPTADGCRVRARGGRRPTR